MCKTIEEMRNETAILTTIEAYRDIIMPEEQIKAYIMKKFNLTEEEAKAYLNKRPAA